jgi:ADP-heptose:LPS heptosyltransferase
VFVLRDSLKEVIDEVRTFNPDVIIDLHHNLRTAIIKAAVGAKSFSFPKLNVEKWMHVNFKADTLPNIHVVERYLQAVEPLGVKNDGKGMDFFIPEHVALPALPEGFENGYVAVVVGAKFATKQIPEAKLAEFIAKTALPIVLLGGADDAAIGARLATRPDVINACGKYTLQQSARLLQHAKVVLTPDTGLMHIAAAFTPTIISVWGSTVPKFGMTPYMPQAPQRSSIVEQNDLNCRPCSKIGFDACPKQHFKCMNLLDIDQLSALTLKTFTS